MEKTVNKIMVPKASDASNTNLFSHQKSWDSSKISP